MCERERGPDTEVRVISSGEERSMEADLLVSSGKWRTSLVLNCENEWIHTACGDRLIGDRKGQGKDNLRFRSSYACNHSLNSFGIPIVKTGRRTDISGFVLRTIE